MKYVFIKHRLHLNDFNFVEFFSYEDVKVYFHRREQFLDLSGRMGYKIYKGETMQSQVSWHDVR